MFFLFLFAQLKNFFRCNLYLQKCDSFLFVTKKLFFCYAETAVYNNRMKRGADDVKDN